MMKITSLGGSGEDSRNCFLVESADAVLLLDCGVRREIADVSRVYPLLTKEIADRLDAVLLSHAHEDHTAALPYLYELGYRGDIYASAETIASTPPFLRKWAAYVRENGGTLPYAEENIEKLSFKPLSALPFPVRTGRSGHIIGGQWYLLSPEGHSLLYTGDLTYDSLLLEADPLPEAEILIIDSAYAGQRLDQQAQYEKLVCTARNVTAAGGKLLLPVPANGRGIDMLVFLSGSGLPLYAESSIVKNMEALFKKTGWIRQIMPPSGNYTAVNDTNREEILSAGNAGVYLFGDGMMTTPVSKRYLDAVCSDPCSKIIISGHSAKGTPANDLLREDFRKQHSIRAAAEQLTIKVHNDEQDVLDLCDQVRPGHAVLFHARREKCASLTEKLNARGIQTVCDVDRPLII